MRMWKKYWKWLVFFFLVGAALFSFLNHAHKHGAEYAFNMEEINGKSDNNPYGIRNDVYDFVKKDLEKPENQFLNDPKVKNLLLNYAKGQVVQIKNFSDKEKSIEISYQLVTMYTCFYINENKRVYNYAQSLIKDKDGFPNAPFTSILFKTKDHQLIDQIVNSYMSGKTLNPDSRSPQVHPEICDRYQSNVLEDYEFWEKDQKIKGE